VTTADFSLLLIYEHHMTGTTYLSLSPALAQDPDEAEIEDELRLGLRN
jgi:hypothetical protein